ncbi:MAG TPA: hypothetical protein VGZ47_03750 [Gemmataceae bacterium]|jgi:hypothetical protein|nr:hypothetical protein [Gemmataceae bacterium]
MRLRIVLLALLVSGVFFVRGEGQDPKPVEKPKPTDKNKELMRRKLEHSQKVLEALVTNDLEMAAKHSEELLKIRKDPNFKALKTTEYELFSDEFTVNVEDLIKAAKDRNLESAKLQYLGMTMACFHCHTYTRDYK